MATPNEKRQKSREKKTFRRRPGTGSFLLSRMARLSARCTRSFRHGVASKALCSAERTEEALSQGIFARFFEWIGYRELVSGPVVKAVATGACGSMFFAWTEKVRHAFLHTKARFFGIAGLVFALYTAGIFFAKEFMGWGFGKTSPADLCTAAVMLLVSAFLLLCGRPLNVCIGGSGILHRLFVGILGMDPAAFRVGTYKISARGGLAFMVGTAMGIATLFFEPHTVLFAVLALLFCLCIPAVPEAGLLAAVICLPVAPLRLTAFFALLSLVGYVWKFFRLKRVFRFGVPELFLVLTVAASALSAWSTGDYFFLKRMLLFACIWFLTVNLITTERLLRKYISALLYGGLITLFFAAASPICTDLFAVLDLPEVLETLAFPAAMGETALKCYMLMMTPIALLCAKRRSGFALILLLVLNAYLLGSSWVCIGLFLAMLLYTALSRGAWVGTAVTGIVAVPAVAVLLGDRLGSLASGFSQTAQTLAGKYLFTGVGSGNAAITLAALAEGLRIDGFATGLYIRLILDGGIALLLLFVAAVFFALQRLFTCLRVCGENKQNRALFGAVAASVILFLLAVGVTDVWNDLRVLGIFFCLCPVASLTGSLYGFEQEKETDGQWM